MYKLSRNSTHIILIFQKDERLWNLVFFIAAGVHVLTGVAFDLLGSGEIQEWNSPHDAKDITPLGEINKKVLRKISASLAV